MRRSSVEFCSLSLVVAQPEGGALERPPAGVNASTNMQIDFFCGHHTDEAATGFAIFKLN